MSVFLLCFHVLLFFDVSIGCGFVCVCLACVFFLYGVLCLWPCVSMCCVLCCVCVISCCCVPCHVFFLFVMCFVDYWCWLRVFCACFVFLRVLCYVLCRFFLFSKLCCYQCVFVWLRVCLRLFGLCFWCIMVYASVCVCFPLFVVHAWGMCFCLVVSLLLLCSCFFFVSCVVALLSVLLVAICCLRLLGVYLQCVLCYASVCAFFSWGWVLFWGCLCVFHGAGLCSFVCIRCVVLVVCPLFLLSWFCWLGFVIGCVLCVSAFVVLFGMSCLLLVVTCVVVLCCCYWLRVFVRVCLIGVLYIYVL